MCAVDFRQSSALDWGGLKYEIKNKHQREKITSVKKNAKANGNPNKTFKIFLRIRDNF